MDWEELRTRAAQALHKRRDLFMHQMGLRHGALRLNPDSASRPLQFFFSAANASAGEASARAELLRNHLPAEASAILREADEICAHRFRLLGYDPLDFSLNGTNEIDWHLDPVHRRRSPFVPWFKIPFLDFATVGDHKVVWELNRHQHLVTLAKARLLTGDDQYVRELIAQCRSWITANPYPLGINWGSTLEVAFRSLSWIWVDQLLAGTAEYANFRPELLPILAFHGRYIQRYLSSYFSPNTHLLGEALTLLFLGTLYPQMPCATRWKDSAWRIVLHESERQVRPDGVYFEQSLHYHVYALDFFLYARLLRVRNAMDIPAAYDSVVEKMLEVVAALAQAGPPEGFGDDDGGRLWNPRRNRTEHMTDPLAVGALTYSRDFPAARLTEESIWLFGAQAVDTLSPRKPQNKNEEKPQSAAFPDGGLYVLADSVPCSQAMVVDAGPQGEGRSGHGHADALSLRLAIAGRRWLVDAGSGVYISQDPADRNAFRGTAAHNTLRVDEADQAVADEPFSWTHIPTTLAETWIAGKTFTYFVGSHDGYTRLPDPITHRRHVLSVASGIWLVRDVVVGRAEHQIEIRWHFASDLEVRAITAKRVDISQPAARNNEPTLSPITMSLIMPDTAPWQPAMEITETLISPAYGALESAPLLRCSARASLPAETATALLTSSPDLPQNREPRNEDTLDAAPRLLSITNVAVQAYELDYHGARHGFLFARANSNTNDTWTFADWSSDARMLYHCTENDQLAHLVVIGGTQVLWHGQPLLQAAGPSDFLEWRRQDAVMNSTPASFSVTALFEQLAEGSRLSNSTSSPYAEKH